MSIQLKDRLSLIFKNARLAALPQSFMSCVLAVVLGLRVEQFSLFNAILATLGVLTAHLSANLFDDIFDYMLSVRTNN